MPFPAFLMFLAPKNNRSLYSVPLCFCWMKEPTINGTFSCGVAAGVWVCVGVSVVLCFHSLLPLFWTEMFYKWASKSQYLVFLFLFFALFLPLSLQADGWCCWSLAPEAWSDRWQRFWYSRRESQRERRRRRDSPLLITERTEKVKHIDWEVR